jgi:NADH-quinone oxidoreductase subunit C
MSELLEQVRALVGDDVVDAHEHRGDTTIAVAPERIVDVMRSLRDDEGLSFNVLIDLTAVDYLGEEPRFEVVYHLASIEVELRGSERSRLHRRLRVKARVPEEPCEIPSIIELWASADWMEREVWDMYGIRFSGRPELTRVLLYEQFEGHPLRKDYPKERRQPLVGPRN